MAVVRQEERPQNALIAGEGPDLGEALRVEHLGSHATLTSDVAGVDNLVESTRRACAGKRPCTREVEVDAGLFLQVRVALQPVLRKFREGSGTSGARHKARGVP